MARTAAHLVLWASAFGGCVALASCQTGTVSLKGTPNLSSSAARQGCWPGSQGWPDCAECLLDTDCVSGGYCDLFYSCSAPCDATQNPCPAGTSCAADTGRCERDQPNCPDVSVAVSPIVPEVMLLIDQSGSMKRPFGTIGSHSFSRWEAVNYALTDASVGAVVSLQQNVRFAANLYTSINGYENGGTCPMLTTTAGGDTPQLNNASAVAQLLARPTPTDDMDTPTGEAIEAMIPKMASWSDHKILVLATDGEPDTCEVPDPQTSAAKAKSEQAAANAFAAGIPTYVLSISDEISTNHLQRLANAGQGVLPGSGPAPYYRANTPSELVDAFSEIIRGSRSCDFTLDSAVRPEFANDGRVSLNGQPLAIGADRRLINETTLQLTGAACDNFLSSETATLSAIFPCDVVRDYVIE